MFELPSAKSISSRLPMRETFAIPKNFVLSADALPFTLTEIWPRLQALTLFGSDIFVLHNRADYLPMEQEFGLLTQLDSIT